MTKIQITPTWPEVKPQGFYVYVHIRAATGEPFYVGKGSGWRAWDSRPCKGRSEWWCACAKKNGVNVKIIKDGMSNQCSLTLEKIIIHKLRLEGCNLVNMTDGGEGTSGRRKTKSEKEHLSKIRTGEMNPFYGKIHTEETKAKMRIGRVGLKPSLGMKHSDDHKSRISQMSSGLNNPNSNKQKYQFWHPVHGECHLTVYEMIIEKGCTGEIRNVARGRNFSNKGWRLLSNKDSKPKRAGSRKVPVLRGDGMIFESYTEAANHMRSTGHEKACVAGIQRVIRKGRGIAYGYTWSSLKAT